MSCPVSIEMMGEEHLEDVLRIEKSSFKNSWSEKLLIEEISNPHSNNYIAKTALNPISSNTIAYISYRVVFSDMDLMKIAVDPEYRNNGIAGFILVESLRDAKEKGAECSFLEVHGKNSSAIGFYLKNGYEIYGNRSGYYEDGDAVLMKREL